MELRDKSCLFSQLPNLQTSRFIVTSQPNERYNCIAFSANDKKREWWPGTPGYFWPHGCTSLENVDSFIAMFETLGYKSCNSGTFEPGTDKVAIYVKDGLTNARCHPKGSLGRKVA